MSSRKFCEHTFQDLQGMPELRVFYPKSLNCLGIREILLVILADESFKFPETKESESSIFNEIAAFKFFERFQRI